MSDMRPPADASGVRRIAGLLAVVALVCGGVAGAVWDRERDERQRDAATGAGQRSNDVEARDSAVDEILARRSASVLAVDQPTFLADVDPSATALLQQQRTLFANLIELGLTELSYEQGRTHIDESVLGVHGPTAYLVRVTMTYQIKGVDREPVKTELGYTFAERYGRWMLVDDDDIDHALVSGGHQEPWDLGRIEIHRSPRVMVLVDKGETALGRRIAAEAKEALASVDRFWPRAWRGSVLISAVDERKVRGADFAGEDEESAASSTGTYRSLPGVETREGVFAGAYVVVNPAEHQNVDEILLSHEFTHVATAHLGGYEPLWLAEGVAEYVSWKGVEVISGPDDVAEWEGDVRRESLPRLKALPADQGFYESEEDVYGVSWLAVRFLVKRVGIYRVASLYEEIARNGWSLPARDDAMRKHIGLTEAELFAALKAGPPR